jgi:hypothetical protein
MTRRERDLIAQVERTQAALAEVLAAYERDHADDHSTRHLDDDECYDAAEGACPKCAAHDAQITLWRESLAAPVAHA